MNRIDIRNKSAKILEIELKNPLGYYEIMSLKSEIMTAKNYNFLIIDIGKHDFASINVIKYFKEQLLIMEPQLLKFEKIALIHPPEYRNESSNPEIYDYFTSKVEAKKWFLK